MICTRAVGPDSPAPAWPGEPCPDCGHTSLAHPGIVNLTLDACLVCEVQATVQQLRDELELSRQDVVVLADRVASLVGRVVELEARP